MRGEAVLVLRRVPANTPPHLVRTSKSSHDVCFHKRRRPPDAQCEWLKRDETCNIPRSASSSRTCCSARLITSSLGPGNSTRGSLPSGNQYSEWTNPRVIPSRKSRWPRVSRRVFFLARSARPSKRITRANCSRSLKANAIAHRIEHDAISSPVEFRGRVLTRTRVDANRSTVVD